MQYGYSYCLYDDYYLHYDYYYYLQYDYYYLYDYYYVYSYCYLSYYPDYRLSRGCGEMGPMPPRVGEPGPREGEYC